MAESQSEDRIEVAGVELSHPDRVLYPDQGLTKRELAHYYRDVADRILPWLDGRPLALVRCPEGRDDSCFFQKHLKKSMPEAIGGIELEEKDGDKATYVAVDDLPGLVALAQIGTLEIHSWSSRQDDLEHPDWLVFDLDPGPDVPWGRVQQAARDLRALLTDLDLEGWLRATGGKGLHVVVPIIRRSTWQEAHDFARDVAKVLSAENEDRYLARADKDLRQGKVFIDWLRNTRGATSIVNYSTRAHSGAPVATPLRWDELGDLESGHDYDTTSVRRRLSSLESDPWQGFDDCRQSLSEERCRALEERLESAQA